jgi:hypothetical protein
MMDLDINLKKIVILFADGVGNLRMPIRRCLKKKDGYAISSVEMKEKVERYLYSLMELKTLIAVEFMKEVE